MIARWWLSRTDRERWVLGAALSVLVTAVAVQVLLPALTYRSQERARYAAERTLAAVFSDGERNSESPDAPIQTVVAEAASRFGLTPERFLPGEGGYLTVWLDAADPDALYGWLMYLETYGIGTTTITLDMNRDRRSLRASITFTDRSS